LITTISIVFPTSRDSSREGVETGESRPGNHHTVFLFSPAI